VIQQPASLGVQSTVFVVDTVNRATTLKGHSDSSTSTSEQVAALWLSVGGRGLDTANSYHNQDQVGAAVKASGLSRQDVFVTTKIFCAGNASGALAAVDSDLEQLG
jgi:diketogulonate reductase-like aldo/keto reductase